MRRWASDIEAAFGRFAAEISPQQDVTDTADLPDQREWQRRGRLLAILALSSLAIGLCLLPECVYPRFIPSYVVGLLTTMILTMGSLISNRKGHVRIACRLYLSALFIGCTLALFGVETSSNALKSTVYPLFALPIVQAGFLLGRIAPLALGGAAVCVAGLHLYMTTTLLSPVPGYPLIEHPASRWLPILMLMGMSLLSWLNALSLERALAQADRTEEVELLYTKLQRSHQELEAKNREVHSQTDRLSAMYRELLATQTELEASCQHLAQMNQRLEEQATTDSMTGLANHRSFQQSLRAHIELARRQKHPLTLMLLDVDHFKRYNDKFGHPAGDEVLRIVGEILRTTIRISDEAARYGGEEFVVILPQTELPMADVVAERLRRTMESYDFPHRQITVSIGLAALDLEKDSADMLIQRADTVLYKAKHTGRNRVVIASSPDRSEAPASPDSTAAGLWPPVHLEALRPLRPSTQTDAFGGIEGLLQEPSGPILMALLDALDQRESEAPGHSMRVARYALRLASALSDVYGRMRMERPLVPWITPTELRDLALGALLHDIGKIHIPDMVLQKPGSLSETEWSLVRRHPIIGVDFLTGLPALAPAVQVVRSHHERWDGGGYPDGLIGEHIPLTARLFAVSDALDALTTDCAYREGVPLAAAREEIRSQAGTQFDPTVIEAFLEVPLEDWERLRTGTSREELPTAA